MLGDIGVSFDLLLHEKENETLKRFVKGEVVVSSANNIKYKYDAIFSTKINVIISLSIL
jgi:hypothetical protein